MHATKLQRPWLFLVAAILTEVTGVVAMKLTTEADSVTAMLLVYTMVGLSFYFLALAVKHIPIALAYSVWEASGLLLITIMGVFYLGEQPTTLKFVGIVIVIIGVVLINADAPASPELDS